jgi:hypothetical protein
VPQWKFDNPKEGIRAALAGSAHLVIDDERSVDGDLLALGAVRGRSADTELVDIRVVAAPDVILHSMVSLVKGFALGVLESVAGAKLKADLVTADVGADALCASVG